MKLLIGIQQRSNSKRLPEKAFAMIGDKTLTQWVYEACACVRVEGVQIDTKILTPYNDAKLQHYCDEHHIPWEEAAEDIPENDLVARYHQAGEGYDATIRVTGDEWNIHPSIITNAVEQMKKGIDYASNTIIRTMPEGQDVQAASKRAWEWLYRVDGNNEHPWSTFDQNQHVRDGFVNEGKNFTHILDTTNPIFQKNSIDTEKDLENARKQVQSMAKA